MDLGFFLCKRSLDFGGRERGKNYRKVKSQRWIIERTRGGEWKLSLYAGEKSSISVHRKLLPLKWVEFVLLKKDNLETGLEILSLGHTLFENCLHCMINYYSI